MIQTREELQETLKSSGAKGSSQAVVTVLWDALNLPDSGRMVKLAGELGPKVTIDSKGILMQVRIAETPENLNAVAALRVAGHGIAVISQEPEFTDPDEDPNQTKLPLDEAAQGDEEPAEEETEKVPA